MGQYYHPIILEGKKSVKAWMSAHDYNNGLKLMEHSWLNNDFVMAFESLLTLGNKYHKSRIVWAGDYADPEPKIEKTLYSLCEDKSKIKPESVETQNFPFIVNHSKKLYVDKREVPDNDGWSIHPLPLLTCEGNGNGGGDFNGDADIIGSWARDIISVECVEPDKFTKIHFYLF